MAKVLVRRLLAISFLFLEPAITSSTSFEKSYSREICSSKECKAAAQHLRNLINLEVDPCDDFYEYTCGNWENAYETNDTLSMINERVYRKKLEFMKKKNSKDEHPTVHKARRLFSLCKFNNDYRKASTQIEDILQTISVSNDNSDDCNYAKTFAHITRTIGYKLFFDLGVTSNPYNNTMNMIRLSDPDASKSRKILRYHQNNIVEPKSSYFRKRDLREIVKKRCQNMDKFNCIRVIRNSILSEEFMKPEQRKNTEKYTIFPRNNKPKIFTLKQLQDMSDAIVIKTNSPIPKFNWTEYIKAMFGNIDGVVLNLDNSTTIEIAVEDLEYIKLTIEWIYQLDLIEMEIVISVEIYFDLLDIFYYRKSIHKTLENSCLQIVEHNFPLAVDYFYVKQKKYEDIKTKAQEIFNSIRSSFELIIQNSWWIKKQTRKRTLDKLKRMKALIAFPDINDFNEILDKFNRIVIFKDFLKTRIEINLYHIQNELKTLNQITASDTTNEFFWCRNPPSTVNAAYFEKSNTAVIPAGILEPPIFTGSLKALDYGSIGYIMGHEMTHGFDSNGINFDEHGNRNWWDEKSAEIYEGKTNCFLQAYDKYHKNNELTIGEDISDNGAFHEALLAYRTQLFENREPLLPHFENFTLNQLFTLGFANTWCAQQSLSTHYQYGSLHSSYKVRINEVCRNSAEFSRIWKCPTGSKMNPKKKCTIW